ncbi:MAG TPA: SLBB domain-containing protein [Burkholderiales bacterium]|nr:SLBB domain-containing protein [Burkholderiales bacterium]
MRNIFFCLVTFVAIGIGAPARAQLENPQSEAQQEYLLNQARSTGQMNPATAPGGAVPGLQDIRSPQTTIVNRPVTQQGIGNALAPGARSVFPGTDLQQRINEFEFDQLQQEVQAEQRERNEFQKFVMESTGRDLPIFGQNLFRTVPSTFAPVDNIPVTADYVIGPGDEIQIRAWGQIDVDFNAVVDRDGSISVPKVGVISVAGVKANDLPAYLKTVFGRTFRNFQLTATLGKLRSIQIFVVGQAKRPGTYTVSSLSTLVTAVFAAGGPSPRGSMRSIQLKRGNRVVADFDLYDLIVSGDKSKDAPLLPGDVIYIPPAGALVAVTGSVKIPAVYELKQDTVLFDVFRWAGGLATTAAGQKATVERIEDHKARAVEEFPLDMGGLSRQIRDGDMVTVYSVVPRFDNAVVLRGAVAQPGRFPWRDGMRVRDLIPDREALLSRDYWVKRNQAVGLDDSVAAILRQQSATGTNLTVDELNQRRQRPGEPDATVGDHIRRAQTEAEAAKFLDPNQASSAVQITRIQDASKATVEAAKAETLRLVNQIKPSQKEVNWDYAVVERINRDDLSTSLIAFNLAKAVVDGDPDNNVLLKPGDIVTVFSKEDIKVPISKQTQYIRLEGEFKSSGVHQIVPGETLKQLVARVGGLTPNAYLFGARFTRESTRLQQEKTLDEALYRLERDMSRFNALRAQNVTSPEDAASLKQQAENQQILLARLRQIRPIGRIVLELPETAKVDDLPDMPLEDGDRFVVPPPPSMVSVVGSVYGESSFVYKPDKRVADYLVQAGGPTKAADQGSIYVLRADGSVKSKRQEGFFTASLEGSRLMPGDAIVVPEELDRTTVTRALKDISQIFYQFGLGAAAIAVLHQSL